VGSFPKAAPINVLAWACAIALPISPVIPLLPTAPNVLPIPAVTKPETAPIPTDFQKSPLSQLSKPPSLNPTLAV
jgi:hypothetical protein